MCAKWTSQRYAGMGWEADASLRLLGDFLSKWLLSGHCDKWVRRGNKPRQDWTAIFAADKHSSLRAKLQDMAKRADAKRVGPSTLQLLS